MLCHACVIMGCPTCERLWFRDPHHPQRCPFCREDLVVR